MQKLRILSIRDRRGFSESSVGKESVCYAGDPYSTPRSGRSTGKQIGYPLQHSWASLVAQLVKNLPAMPETWVLSQGWEDPLEKERLPTPVFLSGEFHELYIVHGVAEATCTHSLPGNPIRAVISTTLQLLLTP